MRNLASPELAGDLDLVAFFQEPPRILQQKAEVVLGGAGTNLYTLYFLLFALPFLLALAELVLVMAKIENLGNGGVGRRRDQDEIQSLFPSQVKGLPGLHDAQLAPVRSDDPYIPNAQHALVRQGAGIPRRFSPKTGYRFTSILIDV